MHSRRRLPPGKTVLLDVLKPITLLSGSHPDTGKTGQGCFMNVIAYLNGETQITDTSRCVCPVVRPIAIWINDYLMDSERHVLLRYIERAMGSATLDREELIRRACSAATLAEEMADLPGAEESAFAFASESAKAAAEVGDVVEASDAAEVSGSVKAAVSVAVEAGMDAVSASMTMAVSATMTVAMSAAVTPASGRDGRGKSRRNERAGDGSSDGHCSKHGAVSSWAIHPRQC